MIKIRFTDNQSLINCFFIIFLPYFPFIIISLAQLIFQNKIVPCIKNSRVLVERLRRNLTEQQASARMGGGGGLAS